MGVRSWYRFVPESYESANSQILARLRHCGIVLCDRPACLGLLFFSGQDKALQSALREGNRHAARILAVSLDEHAPPASLCWSLMEGGASDVIWWGGSKSVAQDVADRLRRWDSIEAELESSLVRDHLVGGSRTWTAAVRELIEIARFSQGPCLLQGESGTGKEIAARLIHTLDQRADKGGLVVVDCSTIVPELSGSEFFGHERGAYTSAVGRRDGAFSIANGGTLFLDEVGELPLPLQAQLLRVIQEGTFKPVGGNEWRTTSFRLVCATNRDLKSAVSRGEFRTDLYYRVAGAVVSLPSLRQRREDILPLVSHFIREARAGVAECGLDDQVKSYLLGLEYPGNVRELRQIVNRMCARHAGDGPMSLGDLAPEDLRRQAHAPAAWRDGDFETCIRRALFEGANLREIGHEASECAIRVALEETLGNLRQAARKLGVTDRALQIRRAVRRDNGNPPLDAFTDTESA